MPGEQWELHTHTSALLPARGASTAQHHEGCGVRLCWDRGQAGSVLGCWSAAGVSKPGMSWPSIPGLPANPGEAARKVLGFFRGSGSSPRAAGTCIKQAPARPRIVDSIQGQAWQPSLSSPRDTGTEQHSRAASPKLQAWIFAAGQTIKHISPTETPRGLAKHKGAAVPGRAAPFQRAPCGTWLESGGNCPWNKVPACRGPENSPKSFKCSQETDEGFRCHSPGTE